MNRTNKAHENNHITPELEQILKAKVRGYKEKVFYDSVVEGSELYTEGCGYVFTVSRELANDDLVCALAAAELAYPKLDFVDDFSRIYGSKYGKKKYLIEKESRKDADDTDAELSDEEDDEGTGYKRGDGAKMAKEWLLAYEKADKKAYDMLYLALLLFIRYYLSVKCSKDVKLVVTLTSTSMHGLIYKVIDEMFTRPSLVRDLLGVHKIDVSSTTNLHDRYVSKIGTVCRSIKTALSSHMKREGIYGKDINDTKTITPYDIFSYNKILDENVEFIEVLGDMRTYALTLDSTDVIYYKNVAEAMLKTSADILKLYTQERARRNAILALRVLTDIIVAYNEGEDIGDGFTKEEVMRRTGLKKGNVYNYIKKIKEVFSKNLEELIDETH